MFKFIIQFFLFLWLLFYNKKRKKNWFTPSGVLIGLYTISSLFGIAHLFLGNYYQPFSPSYWWPMLIFDSFLLLYLYPIVGFKENEVESLTLPSRQVLDVIALIIIVLSFFSIIFFSGTVLSIFSSGQLRGARNELASGETLYVEAGLANTIASVSASFYVFALLLFFIYHIKGYNKTLRNLLIISSLSEPLHVLAYVGRDGVVLWIFTFLFLFAFFYRSMHVKLLQRTKKTLVIIMSVLLVPFLSITISRFGGSNSGSVASVISYLGQGFINGPLMFGINDLPLTHGSSFPLFFEITGMKKTPSDGARIIGDWISWTFPTFVGSFVRNFGKGYTLLIGCILFLVFQSIFGKRKTSLPLHKMIIYLLFLEIYGEGIFYFRHYTRGGNLFILLCFLLYFILPYVAKYNNKLSLK